MKIYLDPAAGSEPAGGSTAVAEAPADDIALSEPVHHEEIPVAKPPEKAAEPAGKEAPAADAQVPAAKAEPKPSEAVSDAAWMKELLKRAQDDGMSEEDLKAFPTRKAAETALSVIERRYAKVANQPPPAEQPAKEPVQPNLAKATQPPPAQAAPAVDPLAGIPDPPEDVFGSEFVKGWSGIKGVLGQQLAARQEDRQHIERLMHELGQLRQERWHERFDATLSTLGKEAKALYGEGRGDEFEPDAQEVKNRSELYDTVMGLYREYASRGRNVPLPEIVRRAHQSMHGTEAKQAVLAELNEKNKRFGKGASLPAVPREPGSENTDSDEEALFRVGGEDAVRDYRKHKAEQGNGFFLPE